MNLTLVFQSMFSGIMMGSVFALLGIGFSLVWGVMKVINISHAAFGLLAAFMSYTLLNVWGIDPILSIAVSVPLLFLAACVIYRFLIAPLTKARDIIVPSMILTFGIAIILENLMLLIWSPDPRLLTTAYTSKVVILGPFYFQYPRIAGFLLACAGVVVIHMFLKKTYTGKAVRAAWQQRDAAQLYGVNLRWISMITFGLAVSSAAAGGVGMALLYSFEPHTHNLWLIYLFLVVIVGGVGSVLGAALAGLTIGIITGLSMAFLPYQWVNLLTFALLMIILIFRPQGLFQSEV
ncbi:MAG: branched-chain amino acid ABC transporter permease [Deltaproteobacteria bacterium]|nr:branched-chain amino acid ABC transporter permease [Deltaproteobacteria bacterium]MBW1920168.1 branched-chain amino acid ABC transporter permease [Deltaproteobacteria bacterium]MBW1934666.1 branched-chain amino acid ABC transporter permease [Deltaproteobacteria bacterium]MBW1978286.1 branched-chain amino acid ABC transporter permease [Deltaproteobacteria bacterium]MBW2046154.1 branched-chain amino acid ABC transporter permease [Deltaproteobacteria bacterium]